jgi:hypothetical protein
MVTIPHMGATIYFRNSKIVVPVSELADALHQLTIAEASLAAFANSSGGNALPSIAAEVPATASLPRSEQVLALDFLKLIKDFSRSGGAPQTDVMRVLGATHPKGIGSKAALVNRAIASVGFKVEDVYSNDRDPSGARYWKARSELNRAMEALGLPGGTLNETQDKQETLI